MKLAEKYSPPVPTPHAYTLGMGERLDFLKEHSEEIRAIAAAHKGLEISIFGSVARGDDHERSDHDFLVKFGPGTSLFDIAHLEEDLIRFLHTDVDVISVGALQERDHNIRNEAIRL